MKVMRRDQIEMDKNTMISVVQLEEDRFEIAVLYNPYPRVDPDGWDIDYSKFDDVITVTSSMGVYGVIKNDIVPAYREKTGFEFV